MKKRILAIFVVMAMILTLTACSGTKEKDQPSKNGWSAKPQSQMEAGDDEDNTSSELQEKWNGIWYGYMWVQEYYGAYEGSEFDFFDAFMNVDVDASGKGTMQIYLGAADDYVDYEALVSANRLFIEADVTASEYLLNVTEGRLLDATGDIPLDPEIWVMGQSYQDDEPQVTVVDSYRDADNDGFEYIFHFRIYGSVWEDQLGSESSKRVPPGYDGYIAELDNEGVDGSDSSGGSGSSSGEPQPSAPSDDSNSGGASPSAPVGGTGATTTAKIVEYYDWLQSLPIGEKEELAYEDFASGMGIEGEFAGTYDDETPGLIAYKWTAPNRDVLQVFFLPKDDGRYYYNQMFKAVKN